jgi:subtilisin family serine protease
MAKVDRGLILEAQGVRTDPTVPDEVPTGSYARILLTFNNGLQQFEDIGFIPGIVMGDMATGVIPLAALSDLADMEDLVRVDYDRRIDYRLDKGRVEVKADKVQNPPPGPGVMGYDGSGVIVGIIDGAFDYRHKAFRKGDGTGGTRILHLWDQMATDWQPGLNYGKKYTQQQIDASIQSFGNPPSGQRIAYAAEAKHGSHVASIAAGSGWPDKNGEKQYVGIAPGADLILVDSGVDLTGGFLAEAVAFIAQHAQALGKRCVINMSLGYPGFACDGFSPIDRCMNAIAAQYPGVILVASAGNNGGYGFHTQADVTAQPLDIPLLIHGDACVVYLWFADGENFMVSLSAPPGSRQTETKIFNPAVQSTVTFSWPDGNDVSVAAEVHPYNLKRRITIVFRKGKRATVAPGAWTISVGGPPVANGRVHAWIDFDYSVRSKLRPRFLNPSPAATIESPACAQQVIAVGSYVTRNTAQVKMVGLGSLSFFSSRGPLLSETQLPAQRIKPDICAPGHIVRSASTAFKQKPGDQVVDAHHMEAGTSMASPHVVGVIALLLQKESWLNRDQVFARITQTARKDIQTGNVPNTDWGYGKIDAWAALNPPAQANAGGPQAESLVPEEFRQPLKDLGDSMARTAEGRAFLDFFDRHLADVIHLIRTDRRICTAWFRHGAPVVHTLLTHLRTPDEPLPPTLYGRSVRARAAKFLRALWRYGGAELRAGVAALSDPLPADGLTWTQIRGRFEV